MNWRRTGFILPLALALAGCGFQPLYNAGSSSEGVIAELQGISIEEPDSRLAQLIRNDLLSSIRPAGTGGGDRYLLSMTAVSNEDSVIETRHITETSREVVRVTVRFSLKAQGSGAVEYEGGTFSHVPFDVTGESFADLQARTNALERAAHEVSLDIRTRLAAHFASGARTD
jgi:LPS-assembly lipoprotein